MKIRPNLYLSAAVALVALPWCVISCTQSPSATRPTAALPSTGAPSNVVQSTSPSAALDQHGPTIKDTYKGHFLIGTSADVPGGFSDEELALIKDNFSVITPENYLKPAPVHPLEDVWAFTRPDALVQWCNDNNIAVHGHTLVWHSQTNGWFFQGGDRDTIIKRLHDHITTLVGRYKGRIRSWDVVNEAIDGNGGPTTENLRNSQWLQAIGPDFLTLAFKFAHEADPGAKLYYNDYNIETGVKHQNSMVLLKRLIRDGAPIYGVGIQGHWSTTGIPFDALDKSISDYASLGLKVSISELDVTINGATGGQLAGAGGGGNGGGGGFGRGAGRGPATAPAIGPAAPPAGGAGGPGLAGGPAGGGAGGRGAGGRGGGGGFGGGGGGFGGGPGRGGAQAPIVNLADTVAEVVTDLTDDQKTKLTAAATDQAAKIAPWQKSSQAALLSVQPQYTPGQVAYQHEQEEYTAEQAKQNALRDDILDDAELHVLLILTPAQAEKWEASRLNTQFTTRFGTLTLTDAQKAKVDAIVGQSAHTIVAARDKSALADAKAAFPKTILTVLDDTQLAQYQANANRAAPAAGRGGGGGRGAGGGNSPSPAALKSQADAYAHLFTIFEKHKDTMDRITIWGLNDARSWRSGQSPVLFDPRNQRKPAYAAIVDALLHSTDPLP